MERYSQPEKRVPRLVWLLMLFLMVPVITGLPPYDKAAVLYTLSFIVMSVGGSLSLYYIVKSVNSMKVMVSSGELVISYSLGRIRIPLSIIREVNVLDSLGKMVRIGGFSLPTIIDVGYYYEESLGKIKAFITRKTDLLLVILKNNAKLVISPEDPTNLAEQLKNRLSVGEERPIRVESRDPVIKGVTLIVFLLTLLLSASIYQTLPSEIPIDFDSHWQPQEYAAKNQLGVIITLIIILILILLFLGNWFSRSFPGIFIAVTPFVIGLSLILLSILYLIQWYTQM